MDNVSLKRLFTIDEVMIVLNLGRTTIYKEINLGNLIAKKCGNRTLIPTESINSWIEALPAKCKVGGCDE